MSAWTYCLYGKAALNIVPPRLRIPKWKGLGADSEEKHEPASDIHTASMESLKVLDPRLPIREEADVSGPLMNVRRWVVARTWQKRPPTGKRYSRVNSSDLGQQVAF